MHAYDEKYMQRCLELAERGLGHVAPNPMVGAVLVYQNRIIGEGYHQSFGGPHAEVYCLASVKPEDKKNIADATLYVSLEPCSHYGKTPPCTQLIMNHGIKKLVVACTDPFEKVKGSGIAFLKQKGVVVTVGCLEKQARFLNRRFFSACEFKRPWIILKWAQSSNGKVSETGVSRKKISGELSNLMVHRWRHEEQAIMVGTQTAIEDNPMLNTRLWPGKNPLRISINRHNRLPAHLHLLDGTIPTLIFGNAEDKKNNITYLPLNDKIDFTDQLDEELNKRGIQSLIVEGGPALHQYFIDNGRWDEARIITNNQMQIASGKSACDIHQPIPWKKEEAGDNTITYFLREAWDLP